MNRKQMNLFNKGRVEIMNILNSSVKNSDVEGNTTFNAAYYIVIPDLDVETTQVISKWSPELHKRLDKKFRAENYIYFYGYVKPFEKLAVNNRNRYQYVILSMDNEVLLQHVDYKEAK